MGAKYLTRITGSQYQGGEERKGGGTEANLESLPASEEHPYFDDDRLCTTGMCSLTSMYNTTVALCMHGTQDHGTETELQLTPARTVSMLVKRK